MWTLRIIALIYLMSSLWCIFQKEATLAYLGFELTSDLAHVEYFSVYGGIQMGIALSLLICSFIQEHIRSAIFFALIFSITLAAFRWLGMFLYQVPEGVLGLAILEVILPIFLFYSYRKNKSNPVT